jgi:hypothetical protein
LPFPGPIKRKLFPDKNACTPLVYEINCNSFLGLLGIRKQTVSSLAKLFWRLFLPKNMISLLSVRFINNSHKLGEGCKPTGTHRLLS